MPLQPLLQPGPEPAPAQWAGVVDTVPVDECVRVVRGSTGGKHTPSRSGLRRPPPQRVRNHAVRRRVVAPTRLPRRHPQVAVKLGQRRRALLQRERRRREAEAGLHAHA